MNKIYFRLVLLLILFSQTTLWSQDAKQIVIQHSDFLDISEKEVPGAIVLTGNVVIIHEGVRMTCNKAYHFTKSNFVKIFGNVNMVQGDTLSMNSKYAEYNGNTKFAYATGDVVLRDPKMTLATDTINFDRNSQQAYYNSKGTIRDPENTLVSNSGKYYLNQKKFQFSDAVTVTNPRQTIKTNHLDYYTNSGHAYVFGPSTITSATNTIYTTKGFYDTKKDEGKLQKGSKITYKDRLIEGDDIYYDRKLDFARAKNNVKVTDTINHFVVKGNYAEVYKQKDSMFITKKAVAITLFEKDSVYFHAKKILVTGKPESRIIRGSNNARFFKKDISGKCDSIHYDKKKGLTQMIGKPVLWNGKNQMTGDVMHLVSNQKTEKIDSLKVLNNAFIISKDTIGEGFNQVKGQNLFGKFKKNKLHEVNVIKNTEVIFYMRNEKNELIGINKNVSSKINMILEANNIETITFFTDVEGIIYPEEELPENARKLKGFIWRGDEQILTKEDLFPKEELELDAKAQKESKAKSKDINIPMQPSQETLEYDKQNVEKKVGKKKKK
ncbi:OstA-like protein [Flavobacterium psychrophilum]|uniref:OstA-like protein n=1 Tax=Flavobacterium psychrophilum TaxID=96345 RepID=UPI000B7C237E|nr:OstA-like protein [Flavobacterium psychrophilum]EKT3964291.1 OstA-like protein [Flavobacterium psychrophilum]EKT4500724.1 OstA-like protein [Flavobacterium psychrophilum]EKT4517755.1 OstA-like protein [Flavobacterium psychrophilum]ELY2009820.1 OstA-like protein [Flavobacterium psychrophilum]MCB6097983.1 OstA-like protein [Flavobacterium psychrophilum]